MEGEEFVRAESYGRNECHLTLGTDEIFRFCAQGESSRPRLVTKQRSAYSSNGVLRVLLRVWLFLQADLRSLVLPWVHQDMVPEGDWDGVPDVPGPNSLQGISKSSGLVGRGGLRDSLHRNNRRGDDRGDRGGPGVLLAGNIKALSQNMSPVVSL